MVRLRLFPGQTAADGLLILILIYTGCVVLTSITAVVAIAASIGVWRIKSVR